MNKLDPETKADFVVLVIVTALVVLGVFFYKIVFDAVQPQVEPIRIQRDQFGHRKERQNE